MEQDNLQSMWKDIRNAPKGQDVLRSMLQQKNHPELRRVRKQMIIEMIAFGILLFVYYDLFDGEKKPLYANVLMSAALICTLGHNAMVYMFTKRGMKGDNIKQLLVDRLSDLKTYGLVSVAIRVLTAACLLVFFTSTTVFNTAKYWMLAGVILVFVVQIILLSRIWITRGRRIKETIESFS